ncbi:hypothetical protein KVT40_007311 [Elsinoe batatas]|uniref:GST N-terminal domain-containing protein n=1 Tax=Elsinoe batatas TaxID=2601811 RepID=A0A8K0KUP8_9PEZI|nr:hypothetical protein KVT40_007311 [Elsinoe batatas]
MVKEIILYDLPSKQGTPWSLNPWKTRMILNFKGIDYKTEWVEYPDIAPKFKSFGIEPNKDSPEYTIPAIQTAKGDYIMDSKRIAAYLEETYPPGDYAAVKLDEPVQEKVVKTLNDIWRALQPVILPLIPRNVLNPSSAEYFQRTRKEIFGMPLDEFEATKGGDEAWKNAEKPIGEMASLLREEDGPYFQGDKSCYADFYFVTFLRFAKAADEKVYDRIVKDQPEFRALYTCMEAYLDKAD